jgi:hypothetical protein
MIKGIAANCANHPVELRRGKGPHAFQLWCLVCNKHIQWVNNRQAIKINTIRSKINDYS